MVVTPLQKRLHLRLACLAVIATAMQAVAYDCGSVPVPYSAHYSVTRNNDPDGSMAVVLERKSDNTFSYTMDTRVKWGIFTAHIEQQSSFSWQDGLVFPDSYRATQRVSIYKRSETVNFDWHSMQATGSKKRNDFVMKLVPGMQDKLTVYLALARALCEGKESVSIDVVTGSRLKQHDYLLQKHESLDTVPGELQLIHIRRGGPDEEKQTDLWLSEKNRFLPVKMVYRDKNIITDMLLIDISFRIEK